MQQHPVPQNITGFEFKLIGFLTLRQFGYLAAPAVVIIILYASQLPFPLVVLFGLPLALFGIALAFFRINDQPFESWLAAFLKTIYSPTIRVWHREPKSLGFLEPQFSFYLRSEQSQLGPSLTPNRGKLESYLSSHSRQSRKTDLDLAEEDRLRGLPFGQAGKQVFVAPKLSVPQAEFNKTLQEKEPRFQRMEQVVGEAQGGEKPNG